MKERDMCDVYDFDGEFGQIYIKKCTCGKEIEVSTQQDEHPEYYTDVYVRCVCGKSVRFTLPVN